MPVDTSSEQGFFASRDGLRLFFRCWRPQGAPRSIVALLHGYLEHCGRYGHVADFLRSRGHLVYGFDYRGHGCSGGRRVYVASYDEYVGDFERYLSHIAEREPEIRQGERPFFVVAHSHGALITLRHLVGTAPQPAPIRGVAVSAPYLENKVKASGFKLWVARQLSRYLPTVTLPTGMPTSDLTHDAEIVRATDEDPLVSKVVTVRWFTEMQGAQRAVIEQAARIRCPLLVMQGMDDRVTEPEASRRFYGAASAEDKTWRSYDGLFHEIFNEVEREKVLADLEGWIAARC